MATFDIVITDRVSKYVGKDPATGKLAVLEDKTPQRMQYLDLAHAVGESFRLKGLLQMNPDAKVEIRPPELHEDAPGEKMSLADWIENAGSIRIARDPKKNVAPALTEL